MKNTDAIYTRLNKAGTEEAVKAVFVKHFKLEFNSDDRVDLLTPPILWEFKLNRNMRNEWPKILAQALYYIRRIRENSTSPVPRFIALVDRDEGTLVSTQEWLPLLDREYDWSRAPSSPDPLLVTDVSGHAAVRIFRFEVELAEFLDNIKTALDNKDVVTRPVTQHNFEAVFAAWEQALGVENENLVDLFTDDVCLDCWFDPNTGELASKKSNHKIQIPAKAYIDFWSVYERPPTLEAQNIIRTRRDRLRAMKTRRIEGEFFTPPLFAEKAVEYLNTVLGKNWQNEYTLWDPAAGTGNLLWPLNMPGEQVYASTLRTEDLAALDWYDKATVFQFDFLNDPVEKLPATLREKLKGDKVIVLMNPPYSEAGSNLTVEGQKAGSSTTALSATMDDLGLGKAANELFVQFLFRIHQLCPRAIIAFFAKLKYINAPAFQKFREKILDLYDFRAGFLFPSKVFAGTSGNWPVSFGVWQSQEENHG